ncbi:GNAT family N-acetyltransferase [Vibrio sp.]|uniref:N-acetyltransferase n=1 Tax=Vibrio viridaestus TaxID=2487322 RepID=A0A3N9TDZ6_9VIBR|nr:GNAT family protein [Vibrio viridaestus]MDC0610441.1 GNAT family N-acetyltransferase [Vibrio sp.]RQW62421.1 N-acetyltransferase [Vibrio viridaestus]
MTIATKRALMLPYTELFESNFLMLNCCTKNRTFLDGPLTVASARDLFHSLLESTDTFAMAVVDNYNREYIGHIQLSLSKGIGDLLFIFDKAYWGRGYAYETLKSYIPNVCSRFSLTEITATVQEQNLAATKLLSKLGFKSSQRRKNVYTFTCDVVESRTTAL